MTKEKPLGVDVEAVIADTTLDNIWSGRAGLEKALARARETLAMPTPSGPELLEALHHLVAQVDATHSMLGEVKGQIRGDRVDQVFFGEVGKWSSERIDVLIDQS